MKISKLYVLLAGTIFAICCIGMLLVSYSLYKNVDESGSRISGNLRIMPLVNSLQEEFRKAEGAEQIRDHFRTLETAPNMGANAKLVAQLKTNYLPLMAHMELKPKDSDNRATLLKKKDFLDATLNFYRKEIPSGDIQVRALLLNIIFDTHSSFLAEAPEMEIVYLKKCREKIANLKTIASEARSPGVTFRISGLEGLLNVYEKAATQSWTWSEEKSRLLSEAEKASSLVVETLKRGADVATNSAQRDFLQNVLVCAIVVFLGFGLLYWGAIKFENGFVNKAAIFKKYFELYGQEKLDTISALNLAALKNDGDWGPLFQALQDTEERFLKTFEAQRSISQFNSVPYLVINRSGEIVYCNSSFQQLFAFQTGGESDYKTLNEFIFSGVFGQTDRLSIQEGTKITTLVESTGSGETTFRTDGKIIPLEIIVSNITSGKYLADGRVILFRTIPDEARRIEAALSTQLNLILEAVATIAQGQNIGDAYKAQDDVHNLVKAVLDRLSEHRLHVEEKETLWKSEIHALLDQAVRQKELLESASTDFKELRERQERISRFFAQFYESERLIHTELSSMERNLDAWMSQQNRLQTEVASQINLIDKAREYEEAVRDGLQAISSDLDGFVTGIQSLRSFREEARLKALNLSLGREAGSEVFSARARSYALEIDKFCLGLEKIVSKVQQFVDRHPANSLFPLLKNADFDASLLEDFRKGQFLIGESVTHWRTNTDVVLQSGVEVQQLLQTVQERGENANKLNDACLLINERTKENLARWN
jgi:PAS domain-containing protein